MFKKILVPIDVDYPKTAAAVFKKAAQMAELNGAEIRLVSVMPGFSMPIVAAHVTEEIRQKAADQFKTALEKFIAENSDGPVSYRIRTGKNWEKIIDAADKWDADLIVVYHNRRRDINEVFSGSCSERVTDNAKCSVLRLRNVLG